MRDDHSSGLIRSMIPGRGTAGARCAVLILWSVGIAGLAASGPRGSAGGTVKNPAGMPVAHAKLVVQTSAGHAISSAITDKEGGFRFPSLPAGHWFIEVQCQGCSHLLKRAIVVKDGQSVKIDFVLRNKTKTPSGGPGSIGAISFYNKPEFETGGLQDPSAGGGYSDSASVQSRAMLQQYLTRGTGKAAATPQPAPISSKSGEQDFVEAGNRMLAQKDFMDATAIFSKGTSLYPDSAPLQMGLGVSLYQRGKYNAAARALADSARLSPHDSSPLLLLAETYQFAKLQGSGVEALFKHFLDQHPENARGHYAYGLYLWSRFRSQGNERAVAGAQSQFEKAVKLDRNYSAAHFHLGILYDRQKATNQAIHEYLEAIRTNPKRAAPHYRLSLDYQKVGEHAKAKREMNVYEELQKSEAGEHSKAAAE